MARITALIKSKGNRLFLKILFYFLSLLVPIVVIGISTYLYSVHVMRQDFQGRITMNLEAAAGTVDLYIKTAQETSLNFFYDDIVRELLMPWDVQSPEIKAELWRIPKIIQRSENIVSEFTDRIFVYNDNKAIYVNGGVNQYDTFFRSIYSYREYDEEFWKEKLDSDKYIELLPVSEVVQEGSKGKKDVVPIVMVNRINSSNAVMVLNISVDSIEKTLRGNAVFKSTDFIVLDGNDHLIYNGSGFSQNQDTARIFKNESDREDGFYEVALQEGKYVVSAVKSRLYGWKYYSITPAGEFNRHILGILQMTILVCIVLMIMGVIFSFRFSLNIYNPIRNIRDIIAQNKDLWAYEDSEAEQGANDFEMIRKGISKLSDHHQQYKVKYDKYTNEYVEYSLLFLLKGHTLNQEEILGETLKSEFGFNKKGYACCSIFFDFKEAFFNDIQDTERLYVINGIKKVLWTILAEYAPTYVMEHRQNLYVSIVNMDNPDETGLLYQAFDKLLRTFEYDIQYCDITIGIGRFHSSVNDIGTSYNEAMTAISKRNKEKRFQIIDSGKLSIENSFFYSFFDEQKILNCIKAADMEGLQAVIDDILDINMKKGISYEYTMMLFKELYSTGMRILAEKGLHLRQPDRKEINGVFAGKDFISAKEMKQITLSFYRQIMEMTGSQAGNKTGNLVTMITRYIENNYTRDLCLEQIADEMGVSMKYVSRIFKEKTGVYLTDFINRIRIGKARELLAGTDTTVNEIAKSIGIESRTTFLRVFKKVEGITPNEYRAMHRKQI